MKEDKSFIEENLNRIEYLKTARSLGSRDD